MNPERCIAMARVFLELEQVPTLANDNNLQPDTFQRFFRSKTSQSNVDRRGKDHILAHADPKGDMPEDTPTDA